MDKKGKICKIIDGKEERLYSIVLGYMMKMLRLMLAHQSYLMSLRKGISKLIKN